MPKQQSRAVKTPEKPLHAFTPEDFRIFRSLSVEDHLHTARRALALASYFGRTSEIAEGRGLINDDIKADVGDALASICEQAWSSTQALIDALDGQVQNLHIVSVVAEAE